MDYNIKSEIVIFLTMVYGGLIIGFVYDLYRVFRYFSKPKKIATFIEDLIFWIIVTSIALFTLLYSNYGELRGFVFIGIIFGALIYYYILSKLVVKTLVYIVGTIINFIKYIINIIISPFKFMVKLLLKPFKKVSNNLSSKYRKSKRIIKLPSRILHDMSKQAKIILFKKH